MALAVSAGFKWWWARMLVLVTALLACPLAGSLFEKRPRTLQRLTAAP